MGVDHYTNFMCELLKAKGTIRQMTWLSENMLYFENKSNEFLSMLMNIWYAHLMDDLNRECLAVVCKIVYNLVEVIVKFKVADGN